MGNKDFDNLQHTFHSIVVPVVAGTSEQVDLEIPKGMIAKFKQIEHYLKVTSLNPQPALILYDWDSVLLADPDDNTTFDSDADTDTDIMDLNQGTLVLAEAGTGSDNFVQYLWTPPPVIKRFDGPESLDLITARPLRHNAQVSSVAGLSLEDHYFLRYTLEEVTDATLMELLGIL